MVPELDPIPKEATVTHTAAGVGLPFKAITAKFDYNQSNMLMILHKFCVDSVLLETLLDLQVVGSSLWG